MSSAAIALQLASKTLVDVKLTTASGNQRLANFFSGKSNPYGDFGVDTATQTWETNGDLTKSGSQWKLTVTQAGEYLGANWLQFGVPAIFNQCNGLIRLSGAAGTSGSSEYRLILPSGPAASGQASVAIASGFTGAVTATVDTTGSDAAEPVSFTGNYNGVSGWFTGGSSSGSAVSGLQYAFIPETHNTVTKANSAFSMTAPTGATTIMNGMSNNDLAPYYCRYAPIAFVRQIIYNYTNVEAQNIKPQNLLIYHACYVPKARQLGKAMNDHYNPQVLKAWAMRSQVWYMQIPTPWSCGSYLSCYPYGSVMMTQLKVFVHTESVYSLIVNGCGSTFNTGKGSYSGNVITAASSGSTFDTISFDSNTTNVIGFTITLATQSPSTNSYIDASHFSMSMLLEWITLPKDEADAMAGAVDQMVIAQHECTLVSTVANTTEVSYQMTQLHPIAAYHVLGQRHSAKYQNMQTNYGGLGNPLTATNDEPDGVDRLPWLKTLNMTFNGNQRFSASNPDYFLQIQNSKHAEQIPDFQHGIEIYSMHFCLNNPYGAQKTGACNPTRIEHKYIKFTVHPAVFADNSSFNGINGNSTVINGGAEKVDVYICAIRYNIGVMLGNNLMGVLFS